MHVKDSEMCELAEVTVVITGARSVRLIVLLAITVYSKFFLPLVVICFFQCDL